MGREGREEEKKEEKEGVRKEGRREGQEGKGGEAYPDLTVSLLWEESSALASSQHAFHFQAYLLSTGNSAHGQTQATANTTDPQEWLLGNDRHLYRGSWA